MRFCELFKYGSPFSLALAFCIRVFPYFQYWCNWVPKSFECHHSPGKQKIALMLMRRATAYSSFCSQVVLVYRYPFRRNSLVTMCAAAENRQKITKPRNCWGSKLCVSKDGENAQVNNVLTDVDATVAVFLRFKPSNYLLNYATSQNVSRLSVPSFALTVREGAAVINIRWM